MQVLLLDVTGLLSDPRLLSLIDLSIELRKLLIELVATSLHRTLVLFGSCLIECSLLAIQSVDLELTHVDGLVALLDLSLELLDLILFVSKLLHEFLLLLSEQLVLLHTVKVVDLDARDFVRLIFDLNFLLRDVLVDLLRLLKQVSRRLLNGLLLRGVVDDVIADFLDLGVQRHDGLLKNMHLLLDVGLFDVHSLALIFSLSDRGLEHVQLLHEPFPFILDLLSPLLKELLVSFHLFELLEQILGRLLFLLGLIADTGDLRLHLLDLIFLTVDEFLDDLESFVSLLHTEQCLLPVVK